MINFIGFILVLYATLLTAVGPRLNSIGFGNRCLEAIDVYRNVILIAIVGSVLLGTN